MAGRERLGSRSGFSTREYVYRARDCFEIDDVEGYEVTRKRVFYDDVVFVTRHAFVPWTNVVLAVVFSGLLGLMALGFRSEARIASFVLFVVTVLLLLLVVLLFAVGGAVVTVQGKRTQARMVFVLRPARAAEVYRRACRLVRERQVRVARQAARPVVAGAATVSK
jgi:hypothetical protein